MAYPNKQTIITGDGNAVGNNNHVTVIKKNTNVYGRDDKKGDDGGILFGIGVMALLVVIVATYYFALHAAFVYSTLQSVAAIEIILALIAGGFSVREGANEVLVKCAAAFFLAAAASFFLMLAHIDYPIELTSIAQQAHSIKAFWCKLSDYGRQLALLHMFTTSIGFFLGLLLVLPTTTIFAYFFLTEAVVSERTYAVLESMTSWWMVFLSAVLIASASYFHTESGWVVWQGWFKQPPSFFCARI
jgi:hypothetical protein